MATHDCQCPTAKPVVVGAGTVRMSVPIVPAQTIKQVICADAVSNSAVCECLSSCIHGLHLLQVVPKPLTPATVVTTTQTQQRLIMPATPLPQIQPNFTNLPPGTVLAPAPGGGNMGYAVVPAQYVTQVSVVGLVYLNQLYFVTPVFHFCNLPHL